MTAEGLKAVHRFSREGIQTNVTLVFSANQALMAARAGATYVSPFIGRLDDISHDGMELIRQIAHIFDIHEQSGQRSLQRVYAIPFMSPKQRKAVPMSPPCPLRHEKTVSTSPDRSRDQAV